jgi:hypothetical protein
MYTFDKNTVFTNTAGGAKTSIAHFNDPVQKIAGVSQIFFVLTEPDSQAKKATNLFAFDGDGKEIWACAASFAAGDKNIFVNMQFDENNPAQLIVWDWDRNQYILDTKSGRELSKSFLK